MSDFDRWVKNLARAKAHSIRNSLWCEALREREGEDAARLIDHVARKARTEEAALSAFLGLLDLPAVVERVGGGKFHDILASAQEANLSACRLLLENPGPRHLPDELGPPPDPVVERMTLGHRKTAARGARSQLLEKLMRDPDPEVAAQVLRNPRLREREVVAIASRRPSPEALFRNIARAPRWLALPAVRRAMVLNPYAPPDLSVALLVSLPDRELKEVAKMEGLHRAVRDGALEILGWS